MKRKELYKGIVTDRIYFPARAEVEVVESDNQEDNGKNVLVKNVIPGQKIEFRLKKQSSGNLINILEKSCYETEKRCPVFGECGGCVYLPMNYTAQLEMKRKEIVRYFLMHHRSKRSNQPKKNLKKQNSYKMCSMNIILAIQYISVLLNTKSYLLMMRE